MKTMGKVGFVAAMLLIGCVSGMGGYAAPPMPDSPPKPPESTFTAQVQRLPENTFVITLTQTTAKKPCTCDPCDCGENCTCAECAVGCGRGAQRRAARRAARSQDTTDVTEAVQAMPADFAVYGIGSSQLPQTTWVTAPVPPPATTTTAESDTKCPCCGMEMNKSQVEKAKAKMESLKPQATTGLPPTANYVQPPVTYAPAPVQYAAPMYYQYTGGMTAGACAGGNCGTGNGGFFLRRR